MPITPTLNREQAVENMIRQRRERVASMDLSETQIIALDLMREVAAIAGIVHQVFHTDQHETWRTCPVATCKRSRAAIGIPDHEEGG